jgi:hypothetical protein
MEDYMAKANPSIDYILSDTSEFNLIVFFFVKKEN